MQREAKEFVLRPVFKDGFVIYVGTNMQSAEELLAQMIKIYSTTVNIKDTYTLQNNLVLKTDRRAIEEYEKGKYVLVCDGKYVGAFESEKEAMEHSKGFTRCTIAHKSYTKYTGEWGWGSIALE